MFRHGLPLSVSGDVRASPVSPLPAPALSARVRRVRRGPGSRGPRSTAEDRAEGRRDGSGGAAGGRVCTPERGRGVGDLSEAPVDQYATGSLHK